MGSYSGIYRDNTHTYRLDGASIIMVGEDGLEHRLFRKSADEAKAHMKAIIDAGRLRKAKPLPALQRVEGRKKTSKAIIPQVRRKAQ